MVLIAAAALAASAHAATVNRIELYAAETGDSPSITPIGPDTDLSLVFLPKGTGNILVPNGHIGIGTNAPSVPLEIKYDAGLGLMVTKTNDYPGIGLKENSGDIWELSSQATRFDLAYTPNGGSRIAPVSVLENGNVGIGNASPGERLDFGNCGGSNRCNIRFGSWSYLGTGAAGYPYFSFGTYWDGSQWNSSHSTVPGMIIYANGNYFKFATAPATTTGATLTDRLAINNSNGNVGIGTNSPGLGLTVEKDNGNGWVGWFGSSSGSDRVGLGVRSSRASIQGFTSAGAGANLLLQPDAGNVGIRTATPQAPLDVGAAANLSAIFGATNGAHDILINDINTAEWRIGTGGYGLNFKNDYDDNGTYDTRVVFSSDGKVGVGTATPESKLNISATGPDAIRLDGNTAGATVAVAAYLHLNSNIDYRGRGMLLTTNAAEAGAAWFAGVPYSGGRFIIGNSDVHTREDLSGPYTIAKAKMTILPNGNVGIGTTAPATTLDVSGFMKLAKNTAAPATCNGTYDGAVALTSARRMCVCDGTSWKEVNSATACVW